MKSLSHLHLQTSQIRNEEKNLKLYRKQELKRHHTFKNNLLNNKHMKMMMMMMMTRP
jgi:hypothetical protein